MSRCVCINVRVPMKPKESAGSLMLHVLFRHSRVFDAKSTTHTFLLSSEAVAFPICCCTAPTL